MRCWPSLAVTLLAALVGGWLARNADAADEAKYARFFDHVQPLLESRCVQCHGPEKQEGDLRLDSLAATLAGGQAGPSIVLGKPDDSLLVRAVRGTDPDLAMPPKEKLAAADIAALADWVRDGAVWPNPALVLFDDEPAIVSVLNEGTGRAELDRADRHRGSLALRITPPQRFAPRITGWEFRIREQPATGEYRFLRFAWKKLGDGGIMLELAKAGQWPDAKAAPGRYSAGPNTTGWTSIELAGESPHDWNVVTRDLWADMGDATITGIAPTSIGSGDALFDAILLGPTIDSLDAYAPGRGQSALAPQGSQAQIGPARVDRRNPIAKLFKGERLDLWSLEAPQPPAMPTADRAARRNAIDDFIQAKLTAAGLQPAAEADRRTLARRLYFDLLGLPPTPEEVARFVADAAPDAYEQLVDRLLASPHYGERWARHWLDVVRYSDTNGFERDEFRPTMWRYRDYVIRALNSDKPYDQFITEQLAGDELVSGETQSHVNIDRLVATGYLRLGPFDSTRSIFQEDEVGRDQLMADLANTTGSALLGMTMACCQCHDHKYDPLSQADHYRLRAFFAAIKFRDDVNADTTEVCREIDAHNAALDQQIAAARQPIDKLLAPVKQRLAAERRGKFPADVLALLKIAEVKRDEPTRAKLKPFLDQLAVSDKDAVAALDEPGKQQHAELAAAIAALEQQRRAPAVAMGATDEGAAAPATKVFFQGDHTQPRDEVPPGFLSVLDPNAATIKPSPSGSTTGRRRELARWITSPDNPLAARVMVNRIWQHHFGQGLVATPNDFGYSGARPTHPELLDCLAIQFREQGWSIKSLHRAILLSATYRQSSAEHAKGKKIDPDNHLLWRQNVRRLDAETLRDALLSVAGRLLPVSGGRPWWPPLPEEILHGSPAILEEIKGGAGGRLQGWYADPVEQTYVRSIFLVQKQSVAVPFLQAFDLPESSVSCGRRNVTTVAPQALAQFNGELAVAMAQSLAERVLKEAGAEPTQQIERAFQLSLARMPTNEERAALVELVARHTLQHRQRLEMPAASQAALVDACRVLLNVNEFLYID